MHGQGNLILRELTAEGGLHHFQDTFDRPVILFRVKSDIDHAEKIARRIRREIIAQVHWNAQHNRKLFVSHAHLFQDGFHKESGHKGCCRRMMVFGSLQKL